MSVLCYATFWSLKCFEQYTCTTHSCRSWYFRFIWPTAWPIDLIAAWLTDHPFVCLWLAACISDLRVSLTDLPPAWLCVSVCSACLVDRLCVSDWLAVCLVDRLCVSDWLAVCLVDRLCVSDWLAARLPDVWVALTCCLPTCTWRLSGCDWLATCLPDLFSSNLLFFWLTIFCVSDWLFALLTICMCVSEWFAVCLCLRLMGSFVWNSCGCHEFIA